MSNDAPSTTAGDPPADTQPPANFEPPPRGLRFILGADPRLDAALRQMDPQIAGILAAAHAVYSTRLDEFQAEILKAVGDQNLALSRLVERTEALQSQLNVTKRDVKVLREQVNSLIED